jgi:hypothetical protein
LIDERGRWIRGLTAIPILQGATFLGQDERTGSLIFTSLAGQRIDVAIHCNLFTFEYRVFNFHTGQLSSYSGPYGDPDRDPLLPKEDD